MISTLRVCLAFALLWLLLAIVLAAPFTGKVVQVSDGDTLQVLRDGRAEKVRLAGIDCPELNQPYGQAAKRFVLQVAAQRTATIQVVTTDRYGRTVGEVVLPDGRSLNEELVRAGYAWWYRKYSDDALLEAEARGARRGLWAEMDSVPPWEWRRRSDAAKHTIRLCNMSGCMFRYSRVATLLAFGNGLRT